MIDMRLHREEVSILAGLGLFKMLLLAVLLAVVLSGCGKEPVAGPEITPPPKYLMQSPKPFPALKPGDDAVVKLAEAAEVHNREARRMRGLQGYVRKVRGE